MRFFALFLGFLFATGAIVFVVAALGVGGLVYVYSKDLPDYTQLKNYEPPVMTRVHAGDGSILAEYAHERRLYLPSSAIPTQVKQAFISAEDKNFYTHHGIDPEGMVRAAMVLLQGSQAHARCLDHHPAGGEELPAHQRALVRPQDRGGPALEAPRATPIPRAASSSSTSTTSISASALTASPPPPLNYFDKSAHELTLAETAYLAGLPKGPNNYNPFRNREARDRAPQLRHRAHGRERLCVEGRWRRRQGRAADGQSCARSRPIRSPPAFSPKRCAAS